MRKFFLLLVIICLPGCDWNRDFGHPPPMTLRGAYKGQLSATYPGPDDRAITDEEPIRFEFADSTFQYFWIGEGGNLTVAYGSGNYVVGDSTVTFTNVLLQGYYPPMSL